MDGASEAALHTKSRMTPAQLASFVNRKSAYSMILMEKSMD